MLSSNQKKWCLIRSDSNNLIGTGHIMRCLALANALTKNGTSCIFVARKIPDSLCHLLDKQNHILIILPDKDLPPPTTDQQEYGYWLGTTETYDAKSVLKAIKETVQLRGPPALIIYDHYALGTIWGNVIGEGVQAPVLAIDDLSNRSHKCDILIDTTFGKELSDYSGLVPENCSLHVGSDYAMLRPEFYKARKAALFRRDQGFARSSDMETLVICMGGMDNDNVTLKMMKSVESLNLNTFFKTEVLVGKDCEHLKILKEYADQSIHNFVVHGGIECVADFYTKADLCIGAPGSSTWERCCLGLPTINVTIAKNQQNIAKNLAEKKIAIHGGIFKEINPTEFAENVLAPLIISSSARESLSINSRNICDGRGIERILILLKSRKVKNDKIVRLRLANNSDIEQVYKWQKIPKTRKFSNNPQPPNWENHQSWMLDKLNAPDCFFYMIYCDGKESGVLRLDRDASKGFNTYVVSIFIDPSYYGLGVASAALSLLADIHINKNIWAQIHKKNAASISLFLRAGYEKKHSNWYLLNRINSYT